MNNNYDQNLGNNNTQNFNQGNNFQQNNMGNMSQMNGMVQNNMMNQNQMSNVPQMNGMSQNNMMNQNNMGNVPQMNGMPQNNMMNQNNMGNANDPQQAEMIKKKLHKAHKINLHKKKKLHMTKKKVAVLSVVACVLFVVLICLGIFTYTKLNGYTRTIMIYMSGTNLETDSALATFDLNSIDYKKMDNENINVVLIAGGSTTWHNNYIDKNSTSIYELTEDGFEVVKEQDLLNMGKSKTLSDFINYVTDNYKSEKYSLIFWNHGGALNGTNSDYLFDRDSLLLDEIDTALSKTKFAKTKLENVIFRTCLNGTIEYADLFADYADYMIASEEVTIGMAGYHVLNYINDIDVKDDGYEVGKKFIDAYKDQVDGIREDYIRRGIASKFNSYSTYSIVDLDNVDELIHNLNEFMSDIDIDKNFNTIAKTRAKIYEYGLNGGSDTVDLYSLVSELKDLSPEKAKAVLKSFDEAILYNWATNNESRGLSIYFPYSGTKNAKEATLDMYSKIDSLDDYNDFISNFALLQSSGAGKSNLSFSNNNISVTNNNDSSDFVLELTDEQKNVYAKSRYYVFKKIENGEFWPFYIGNSAKLNGNKLVANVRGKGLEVYDQDTNTYEPIPLIESYEDNNYIKYDVSVYLEKNKGDINIGAFESATLSLDYNKTTGEITLGDMVYYTKDEVSNIAVDISQYSHIVIGSMTYSLTDENGNVSVANLKQGSLFYGVEVPIDSIQFRLTDYSSTMSENYATFLINDIYGNAYVTELIKMS